VMRVGCAFHVDVSPGVRIRADQAVARFVTKDAWQICSVTGSKGERRYAWSWMWSDQHTDLGWIQEYGLRYRSPRGLIGDGWRAGRASAD